MLLPKVLVVDDFELVLDAIELVLSRRGFNPSLATDGSTAWSMIQSSDYALVITDLLMPGLNGIELIRRIKEHCPETRVVAISGAGFEMLEAARAAGADLALAKPFSPAEMFEACGG